MTDAWAERTLLWQTSPHPSTDQCDLALVRVDGPVFTGLLVDGAPGRSSARPRWPRETLFAAISGPFLAAETTHDLLLGIGERLRSMFRGQVWRMHASAAAICWNAETGVVDLSEVGDTKAWVLAGGCATVMAGVDGLPRVGFSPSGTLGTDTPQVRSCRVHLGGSERRDEPMIALLTDGAHELLAGATGRLPEDPEKWRLDRTGRDDATLLLVPGPANSGDSVRDGPAWAALRRGDAP